MQSRTPWIRSVVAGRDGWECRLARSTVKCRRTGCWTINAAGWGGQAPSVPELACVVSPGLVARDQVPCPVQATTEWYEAGHDGRFMLNFGSNVKRPGSGDVGPCRFTPGERAPPGKPCTQLE